MPDHTCHAKNCARAVPPRMFMCARHWRMVPRLLQGRVWAAYRPGQETRKDPTREYLDIAREAIEAMTVPDTPTADNDEHDPRCLSLADVCDCAIWRQIDGPPRPGEPPNVTVIREIEQRECTCTPSPNTEGPCSWCDIHGRPSAAWDQGVAEGRHNERVIANLEIRDLGNARNELVKELAADRDRLAAELAFLGEKYEIRRENDRHRQKAFDRLYGRVERLLRIEQALSWPVRLKDGPRDAHYHEAKPDAWNEARAALASTVRAREAATESTQSRGMGVTAGPVPVSQDNWRDSCDLCSGFPQGCSGACLAVPVSEQAPADWCPECSEGDEPGRCEPGTCPGRPYPEAAPVSDQPPPTPPSTTKGPRNDGPTR